MRRWKRILLMLVLGSLPVGLGPGGVRADDGTGTGTVHKASDLEGPHLLRIPDTLAQTPEPKLESAARTEPESVPESTSKPVLSTEPDRQSKPQPAEEPKPAAKPPLSQEMAALRDHLRQALAACYSLPVNTRDNTPVEIMDFCLAFGCYAEITDASSGKKINGVGALCWNYPCAGYQLFMPSENVLVPRVGYGVQRQAGQMLAFLALCMVNPDYEIRVKGRRGTVADLVEYEKLTCQAGVNQSQKLIGLAYYVPYGDTWQNERQETWSVERLVREELARPADASSADVTDRLMALSFALQRRAKRAETVDGIFAEVLKHVRQYQQYALDLENPDGTWNAQFFAFKGNSSDFTGTLRATGRILEWLAFSLPDEQLQEPKVLKPVGYLATVLGSRAPGWNLRSMTPRDLDAVMHAAQALSTYDQRVFRPSDPATPPAEAEKTARTTPSLPHKPNRYATQPGTTTR